VNSVVTMGEYASGGRDVVLEVVVGEGQQGEIRVRHDGEIVAEGSGRVRAKIRPGTGSVRVKAIVNHTNKNTTAATITYRFSGGPAPDAFRGDGDFAQGEPIEFRGEFTLPGGGNS
jgi:hypothetical protein